MSALKLSVFVMQSSENAKCMTKKEVKECFFSSSPIEDQIKVITGNNYDANYPGKTCPWSTDMYI